MTAPFSVILATALRNRGEPEPKREFRKRKIVYRTGFDLDTAYDIVPLAVANGHKVYIDQQPKPYEKTVLVSIYASRHEVFYLKAYASNDTQAANAADELTAMSISSTTPHQELLPL